LGKAARRGNGGILRRMNSGTTFGCCIMQTTFENITKIKFEGLKSKNPLAFKHYNPAEIVEGKTMREHLRFSVVYWHATKLCTHLKI
jgi:hypothetical protein